MDNHYNSKNFDQVVLGIPNIFEMLKHIFHTGGGNMWSILSLKVHLIVSLYWSFRELSWELFLSAALYCSVIFFLRRFLFKKVQSSCPTFSLCIGCRKKYLWSDHALAEMPLKVQVTLIGLLIRDLKYCGNKLKLERRRRKMDCGTALLPCVPQRC